MQRASTDSSVFSVKLVVPISHIDLIFYGFKHGFKWLSNYLACSTVNIITNRTDVNTIWYINSGAWNFTVHCLIFSVFVGPAHSVTILTVNTRFMMSQMNLVFTGRANIELAVRAMVDSFLFEIDRLSTNVTIRGSSISGGSVMQVLHFMMIETVDIRSLKSTPDLFITIHAHHEIARIAHIEWIRPYVYLIFAAVTLCTWKS